MAATLLVFILAVCVCAIGTTPTPPMPPMPPLPTDCEYSGHHYGIGESFSPSLCEHCQCGPGNQTYCVHAECLFVACVDFVRDPTACCPVCPNGENCKAPDGSLLRKGEVYKPNDHTVCRCPADTFGLVGNVALCEALPQLAS